tara:strand:- start:399 stop:542 length:144 start_codon:yes stop_codon:yes gene_type:complete
MALGVDYSKLPNNQISNLYSTPLEIEKIEKGLLGLYGSRGLTLEQES